MKARLRISVSCGLFALSVALASPAAAQPMGYRIENVSLSQALRDYGRISGRQIIFTEDLVRGRRAPALIGVYSPGDALARLLAGSGLRAETTPAGAVMIVRAGEGQAAGGAADNAAAQEQAEDAAQADIVVTGTNIRGSRPAGSPLQSYDRAEVRSRGVATLDQFIETVPQNFGGGSSQDTIFSNIPTNEAASNTFAGSSANLRGFGGGSTLTLIDGFRLASTQGRIVDLSIVPLSAVARVDIMADGASAIYGADAVAGVVNVVTRKDYEGAETRLRGGLATRGDLDELRVSQALGHDWGSGNILVSYEHYEQDQLRASDRDFAAGVPRQNAVLLPSQNRDSAYLSLRQEVTPGLEIGMLGLYADRESLAGAYSGDRIGDADIGSRAWLAGFRANYDFADGWQLRASVAHSRVRSTYDAVLTGAQTQTSGVRSRDRETDLDGVVDGRLISLPGGDVRLAFGISYRHQRYYRSSVSYIGPTAAAPTIFARGREAAAGFAEIQVPLVGAGNAMPGLRRLELSAAARYDDYSDFGSSWVPKLGLRYDPIEALSFRGSYSESFKAPLLADLNPLRRTTVIALPDPRSPTGTSSSLVEISTGNPSLRPESARTWTAGMDLTTRDRAFTASLTYYDVRYADRIAGLGNLLFNSLGMSDQLTGLVLRDPSAAFLNDVVANSTYLGPQPFNPATIRAYVDGRVQNVAAERQRGIDINLAGRIPVGLGTINLAAGANYIFSYDRRLTSTAPAVDVYDRLFYPAKFRGRASAGLTSDRFTGQVALNHVAGYDNDVGGGRIGAWTTVDAFLSYEFGDGGSPLTRGFGIALSVRNLLDSDPPGVPVLASQFAYTGYDPANADPLGRMVAIEITKRW